jgi:acetoin utilization deacetylase AcuC-like enzyme
MNPPLVLICHEDYLTPYHTATVECPARIKAILARTADGFPVVRPEPADRSDILRVHAPSMVDRVQTEGRDTYETALLAAGGAILAAETAMQGIAAFALVRPPGHHAGPTHFAGFCFFNNIAVAVSTLLARESIRTALVLDLDFHRGDGTERIYRHNKQVRFFNASSQERTAYLKLVQQELEGSGEIDVIAVSADFDTYVHDWGGLLYTEDYRAIGLMLREAAHRRSGGRYFAVLEGGYYLPELGINVRAFCDGLAGR